jgi:Uma2 family endonuclease
MATVTAPSLSKIRLSPGSSMQVADLTWQDYLTLLDELGDGRATRWAYRQGVLEIRMPGPLHEIVNRLLAKVIFTLAEELDLDINDLGSTTLNRPDVEQGIEPDSCFYIQNAKEIQGLSPSPPKHIPPDLAIEVDVFSASTDKMKIYQVMGVPEVWVYRQAQLKIFQLQGQQYVEVENSPTFPVVSAQQLALWVQLRETSSDREVVRAVREFCR